MKYGFFYLKVSLEKHYYEKCDVVLLSIKMVSIVFILVLKQVCYLNIQKYLYPLHEGFL